MTKPELEIDYDLAALVLENKRMRDLLNRHNLFIDALQSGNEDLRMRAWSSKNDLRQAEAVLYETLKQVLIPKPFKPHRL